MKHVFALLVIFISLPAVAANQDASGIDKERIWFSDPRGNTFTIYRNLIDNKASGDVRAWVQTEFPQPIQSTSGAVKSLISLYEYDCDERLSRTLSTIAYDFGGSALNSSKPDQMREPVIPGTVDELTFTLVCEAAGHKARNSFEAR
jgi:hypothetical protein